MKTSFILCFSFFTTFFYSQNPFLQIQLDSNDELGEIENAYIVKDDSNDKLYTFIEEERKTYGFKYNNRKELESKVISDGLKRKYKEIIGQAVDNEIVLLLQKNNVR